MIKVKYFLYSLVFFGSLFILLGPEVLPDNFQLQDILSRVQDSQVIIIFNSGGWGDTPLVKADDFRPVIEGIQQTLGSWGYNSIVLPYERTKSTFLGNAYGAQEFFNLFKDASKDLALKIGAISQAFPDKKIIIAGLSSGGTFVKETYERISSDLRSSVYAIAAGTPFWAGEIEPDPHFLPLDNDGQDTLSEGDTGPLLAAFFQSPWKWCDAKIKGEQMKFSESFRVSGHFYSWNSPEVSPQIIAFLSENIR